MCPLGGILRGMETMAMEPIAAQGDADDLMLSNGQQNTKLHVS